MTRTFRRAAFLLAAAVLPAFAFAQEQSDVVRRTETPTTPSGVEKPWSLNANPYASYTFDTNVGDGSSVSIWRAGASADTRLPISGPWYLNAGLVAEYSNYSFDLDGAPNQSLDMLTLQVTPAVEYEISDKWSVYTGGIARVAGEASSAFGDSDTYGAFVAARHKVSDTFFYTFGVGGWSMIEDDCQYFPILGFSWDLAKATNLSLSATATGGSLRLTQALSPTWRVAGMIGYERRDFRLDDHLVADGVLRDTRAPLGVELSYVPSDSFIVTLSAGYVIWSELELDDPKGHELSNENPDPAPFIGLSATWKL